MTDLNLELNIQYSKQQLEELFNLKIIINLRHTYTNFKSKDTIFNIDTIDNSRKKQLASF